MMDNFLVQEKSCAKHINMRFIFEDLVATSLTVKADVKSDKRFEL